MDHSAGHDRGPLAISSVPFHLIPFGESLVRMSSPFFLVLISAHQKKGGIRPNLVASASTRAVSLELKLEGFH